jgi:tRNA nucleotidyltransferase (CCA-adding enzyme)
MMETSQNNLHHQYSVGEHTLQSLLQVPPEKYLRLAMLFHDMGKPDTLSMGEDGQHHFYGHAAISEEKARTILRRLRFDNDTIFYVTRLVRYHDYIGLTEPDMRMVRRAINKTGEEIFPLLLPVRKADILSQSEYLRKEKLEILEKYALFSREKTKIANVCDCTEGLENALQRVAASNEPLVETLTSARSTSSRIRRIALQNLLKIDETLIRNSHQTPLYLRILAAKKTRNDVLSALSESSTP